MMNTRYTVIIADRIVTAQKDHICYVCDKLIIHGNKYLYLRLFDRRRKWVTTYKRHLKCIEPDWMIYVQWAHDPREIWDELRGVFKNAGSINRVISS